MIDGVETERIEYPQLYADSKQYMSWEQYFTSLLEEATRDMDYKRYSKTHLSEYYLQARTADMIKRQMEGIRFDVN